MTNTETLFTGANILVYAYDQSIKIPGLDKAPL
jgi:hypothetical protein